MALVTPDAFSAICPTVAANLSAAQISAHVASAEKAAIRYVGRRLECITETVLLDGSGHPQLPLPVWPVQFVGNVNFDPTLVFDSTTLLVLDTDYTWRPGDTSLTLLRSPVNLVGIWYGMGGRFTRWGYPGLVNRGAGQWVAWPRLPKAVQVTYRGGYTTADNDIVMAICTMAAYTAANVEQGGLTDTTDHFIDVNQTVGFLLEQLARGAVPALGSARQVLDGIKEVRLPITLF